MPSATFYHLPQAKRDTLLQAARDEFSAVPYDEASINRMIRVAGIPRGSFYMYFDGKEDLFRYLMEEGLRAFVQGLKDLLRRMDGDLFGTFRHLIDLALCQQEGKNRQMEQFGQILKLNAGLQQGPLLRSLNPCIFLEEILPDIDRERLRLEREGDLEEMLHILLSLSLPTLWHAAASQEPECLKEHYLARLDILSRGMAVQTAANI